MTNTLTYIALAMLIVLATLTLQAQDETNARLDAIIEALQDRAAIDGLSVTRRELPSGAVSYTFSE